MNFTYLVCPVANGIWVINFFPKPWNDLGRSPFCSLMIRLTSTYILNISLCGNNQLWNYVIVKRDLMLPKLVLSTFQQWNFTWHERKQKNVSVLTINYYYWYLCILFLQHLVPYRKNPLFEFTVVFVGNNEVTNPIYCFFTKFCTRQWKIPKIWWFHTFYKVFFNASCCCYYTVNLKKRGKA